MATQLDSNPHAMQSGDVVSEAPKSHRTPRVDTLNRTELTRLLAEYQELRGMLSISLNMYPLRQPVLRAWQDKLDAANERLERLLQA